jgi:hypothetical protein
VRVEEIVVVGGCCGRMPFVGPTPRPMKLARAWAPASTHLVPTRQRLPAQVLRLPAQVQPRLDGAIERMVKSSLGDVDVDTYAHAQDELYSDSSDDSVDDSQADYDDQLSLIRLQLKVLNPKP